MDQTRLKLLFDYDPETGIFVRRESWGRNAKAGVVGTPDKDGYLTTKIDRVTHKLHRLAFLYMTGEMPLEVDHENRINGDNRWDNLRPADHALNSLNRSLRSDNKTGVKGVSAMPSGRYLVQLSIRKRNRKLAAFDSLAEATEFVQLAREMVHGEFACHG